MTVVAAIEPNDKAESIIEEAKTLADAFGDELHVLHVLSKSEFRDIERETVEESGQSGGREHGQELAAEIAAEIAEAVTDEFTAVGRIGDVEREIVRYGNNQNVRYLVIGGRKRTPVGKAVFGSNTQSVLLNATQPVVTVMGDEDVD